MVNDGKPRCPGCGSANILHRVKTDSFRCRVCGKEWAKPAPTPEGLVSSGR